MQQKSGHNKQSILRERQTEPSLVSFMTSGHEMECLFL